MLGKKKLAFQTVVFDMSGYAVCMRNIILELAKRDDIDLVIEPLRWVNSGQIPLLSESDKILRDLEEKGLSTDYRNDAPNYTVVHGTIATEFMRARYPQKKAFGFTMLETDRIPPMWVQNCNTLDGILVPSYFNLSSFMASGVTVPIRTVPLGIDSNIFNPDEPASSNCVRK